MDNRTASAGGATQLLGPSEPTMLQLPQQAPADKATPVPAPTTDAPAATTPSQEVVKVEPGHGKPIPTMGFPAWLYSLQKMVQADPVPPALSKKEKGLIAEQARLALRQKTLDRLDQLSKEVPTLTVCFVNSKGKGSKTTTWAHISCYMSDILRKPLIGADFNFGSGNGAARLGRAHAETMTMNDLKDQIAAYLSAHPGEKTVPFHALDHLLRRNRYGVATVSSNDQTKAQNDVYGTSAAGMLNTLASLTHYLMIDTGNDITTTVMQRVFDKADIIVFTANADDVDTLLQLGTSMETVRNLGNYRGKVDRSIVAISNIPAGHTAEEYLKYTDRLDYSGEVIEKYHFDGAFTGIPHDSHMKNSGIIDLSALSPSTEQAYLNLAVLILEQGLTVKRHTPPQRGTA